MSDNLRSLNSSRKAEANNGSTKPRERGRLHVEATLEQARRPNERILAESDPEAPDPDLDREADTAPIALKLTRSHGHATVGLQSSHSWAPTQRGRRCSCAADGADLREAGGASSAASMARENSPRGRARQHTHHGGQAAVFLNSLVSSPILLLIELGCRNPVSFEAERTTIP